MSKLILVADTHEIIRESLGRNLTNKYGVSVKTFSNSRDLLAYSAHLKNNNSIPDLVICEHDSPKLNGLETCSEFRKLFVSTPFYLFSSDDKTLYETRAFQVGANGFVQKDNYKTLLILIDNELSPNSRLN